MRLGIGRHSRCGREGSVEFACFVGCLLQEAAFVYFDEWAEGEGPCGGSQSCLYYISPCVKVAGSSISVWLPASVAGMVRGYDY